MPRRLQQALLLLVLFGPGLLVWVIDGYFGFPVCRALFTDAIGTVETYVLQPLDLQ